MRGNIVLIGFASSGKTVVGRAVARKLGYGFADVDELIERLNMEQTGEKLACRDIFVRHGADCFRTLETGALSEALDLEGFVVSTGGGAPVNPLNRDIIMRMGEIVYIYARPEIIFERMQSKGLPAWLRDDPTFDNMKNHWAQRDPVYRSLAGRVVDTSDMDVAAAVEEVASFYE